MKDRIAKWWDKQSQENKTMFLMTALISVGGFFFFKAGYNACAMDVINGIKDYDRMH